MFVLSTPVGERIFLVLLENHSLRLMSKNEIERLDSEWKEKAQDITAYRLTKIAQTTLISAIHVLKSLEKLGFVKRKTVYDENNIRKKVCSLNFHGIVTFLNNFLSQEDQLTAEEINELAEVLKNINWIYLLNNQYREKNESMQIAESFLTRMTLEMFISLFACIGELAERLKKIPTGEYKKIFYFFNDSFIHEIEKFARLNSKILKKLKKLRPEFLKRFYEVEDKFIFSVIKRGELYQKLDAPGGI
jgi:hypothetical protein